MGTKLVRKGAAIMNNVGRVLSRSPKRICIAKKSDMTLLSLRRDQIIAFRRVKFKTSVSVRRSDDKHDGMAGLGRPMAAILVGLPVPAQQVPITSSNPAQ